MFARRARYPDPNLCVCVCVRERERERLCVIRRGGGYPTKIQSYKHPLQGAAGGDP